MKQKTVLITGGGSGIGSRIARVLAEKGYHIVINYRTRKDQAEQLGQELSTQFGIKVHTVQGDVSKLEDCMQMTSEVTQKFSGVDILIHNAGPYIHERKRLEEYTWDEWHYIINGNLNSLFYLTKLLSPHMRNNQWGRIITFGFDRVETTPGWIYRSAFASAKTGVASLTRTIAMEEAEHGITANMVCPGDIIDSWKEKEIVEAKKCIDPNTPIGRPGTGEDVARVVAFLCSDQSDFITGSVIPVTGGKDVLGKIHRISK